MANLRVGRELWRWGAAAPAALTVWTAPKPPFYAMSLAIGVMLGLLLFVTVFLVPRPAASVFGELMMFVYYGYLLPLSTRITHGALCRWHLDRRRVHALRRDRRADLEERGGGHPGRCVAAARDCPDPGVPGTRLGEVRRVLREKIAEHAVEFEGGPGLHLGSRDTRESV